MFLDKRINIRIKAEEIIKINQILNKNKDKYDNISHFIRCATIKLIKEEEKQR
jgi:hypothetical protein